MTAHAEVISSGAGMADDTALDVMGPADLSDGMVLSLRFTQGPSKTGRVVRIEDSGARAVVEVDGKRWWLRRRATVQVGALRPYQWAVGGRER